MIFRVKPRLAISMASPTVKRKTRRGRRKGSRFSSSNRRSLFIPVWIEAANQKRNFQPAETLLDITPKKSTIANHLENNAFGIENFEGCEFFYSHWWNCTPFKKAQKLVRPPYQPIAPNNSTQYIIENHFEIECDKVGRDEVEERYTESELEIQHSSKDFQETLTENCMAKVPISVSKLARSDLSQQTRSQSPSYVDRSTDTCVNQSVRSVGLLETDNEYESPDDIDFFSFIHNDFLQSYEEMKKDKLLRLNKSEIISNIVTLEKTFENLQKKLEAKNFKQLQT